MAAALVGRGARGRPGESGVHGASPLVLGEGLDARDRDPDVDSVPDASTLLFVVAEVHRALPAANQPVHPGRPTRGRAAEDAAVARLRVADFEERPPQQLDLVRDRLAVVGREAAVHALQEVLARLGDDARTVLEREGAGVDHGTTEVDRSEKAVGARDLTVERQDARRTARVVGRAQDAAPRGELFLAADQAAEVETQSGQDALVVRAGAGANGHGSVTRGERASRR